MEKHVAICAATEIKFNQYLPFKLAKCLLKDCGGVQLNLSSWESVGIESALHALMTIFTQSCCMTTRHTTTPSAAHISLGN